MSETTAEFLERVRYQWNGGNAPNEEDFDRLLVLADRGVESLARIERLEAALTPSADTKAAYIGEFHFTEETCDDEGLPYYRKIMVPWTTIKEIMAAIKARAAPEDKT